ncbi:P-loop containing nucleoside triphosphate hydrolase [Parasponia andersonii]|uniref:P-loop containing nucleoside triphosphate hydrolase n=1 Tax=Parasponia andersonii TaxID=3476 RepID=A0A2P5C177_PARAD|nr:P-loop containing nucleoside triphosphate hydrolase [Parasponia andersonii]
MVERFFSVSVPQNQSQLQPQPVMLLSGPPSCGKTSLLFQFAFNAALEDTHFSNGNVVFICNRRRSCQERYGNPRGRELAMIRTLALCHNAITHANETRPCKLLLSDTHHGDSPRLLFIYKRWVSTVFTIKGDGSGSFILKSNNNIGNGSSERTNSKTAKYSIALQYLFLEGITEDCEM